MVTLLITSESHSAHQLLGFRTTSSQQYGVELVSVILEHEAKLGEELSAEGGMSYKKQEGKCQGRKCLGREMPYPLIDCSALGSRSVKSSLAVVSAYLWLWYSSHVC
jgi:hypothetical protein